LRIQANPQEKILLIAKGLFLQEFALFAIFGALTCSTSVWMRLSIEQGDFGIDGNGGAIAPMKSSI
jgi:hypothetical protein